MTLFPAVIEELRKRDLADVTVFGGGIVPAEDMPELEKLGVRGIFTPGASTDTIVQWVREHVAARAA